MRGNDAIVFGSARLGSGMEDQNRSGTSKNGILSAFPNLNRLHIAPIPALRPLKIRRQGFPRPLKFRCFSFHLGDKLLVVSNRQIDESFNLVLIPDNQDLHILRIASRGRLAGGLEQTGKDLVGYVLAKVISMGPAGFQKFYKGIRIGLPALVIDLCKLIRV